MTLKERAYCEVWECHEKAEHFCAKHSMRLCSHHWYRDHATLDEKTDMRP